MPRPKGSQNEDFVASRAALLAKLRSALLGPEPPSSLRAMAQTAEVAVPTLRHYFGDRNAVLTAVFADCHAGGAHELQTAAAPTGEFRTSIDDLVRHIADGFRYGRLDRLHAVGLTEGLAASPVAFGYLSDILEPTIEAVTTRLQSHVDRGEMRQVSARHAAIALLSPVIVLFLHQNCLDGAKTHPIEIESFLRTHVDGFFRGHIAPDHRMTE